MSHDFNGGDDNEPRFAKDGETPCTGVGGLMDYGRNNGGSDNKNRWSKCSNEDLTDYYNQEGGSASFCLNTGTGTGTVACTPTQS